ncbi:MAG: hypothetical protein LC772_12820 [Chloroflexi bacterium]|nr:hypothetical protein [Chloroflexota bacterium]
MTETNITFIPVEPQYIPDDEALDCAIEVLASFVEHADVSLTVQAEVEFFYHGPDPARIRCPSCGAAVTAAWWATAVKNAFEASRLADLQVTLPCCGATQSLNSLDYGHPAGFARFVIDVQNSQVDVTGDEIKQLESCFGVALRRI